MKKIIPQVLLLMICLFLNLQRGEAQVDFDTACQAALPFCSDNAQELTFPNTPPPGLEDEDLGEVGCLNTTPNFFWRYLRIQDPGELVFEIQQWVDADGDNRLDRNEIELDVDFIAWGPFPTSFIVSCDDQLARGCDNDGDGENIRPAECENNIDAPDYYINNEDNTNIVDCSYARESTETFTIPNAQTGEYYLILITNFADLDGVVQLNQINEGEENAGTTDCTILDPGVGPDVAVCGPSGFPVTIEGRFPNATQFSWERAPLNDPTNFSPLGVNTPFLTVDQALGEGVYRLTGLDMSGVQAEGSPDELVIVDVSDAILQVLPVVEEESFAGSYTITTELELSAEILLSDLRAFEYRLDRDIGNGFEEYRPFQSSPVFDDVPPGDYQVVARYANCPASEVTSEILMILGYNKYFTPNGDGFHDTWSLVNIENQPTALIYIFDRHGKLLKQLRPGGPGWDGTFNGKNMPSADYWFRVEFNEPTDPNMRKRVFAGNFSLIR